MHGSQKGLFTYVLDASSLINIERKGFMDRLRNRRHEIIISRKVAEEVKQGEKLSKFLEKYPDVVQLFSLEEEEQYLQVRHQPEIHDGEASAIALALCRQAHYLVIDDKKGRAKAENHDLSCLSYQEFIEGG